LDTYPSLGDERGEKACCCLFPNDVPLHYSQKIGLLLNLADIKRLSFFVKTDTTIKK